MALAWMLHCAPNLILIPQTTSMAHLEKNIAAASIKLTADEIDLGISRKQNIIFVVT
ncbi:MAG: aldo/keto reductase [Xenococcaceae cyanobacterium]